MTKENINLEELKQVFFEILSINESTAKIPTFELITCLVFHFCSQTHDFYSLEGIRRELINQTNTIIKKTSFSDRLNTKKLNLFLTEILSELTSRLNQFPVRGEELCKILSVEDLILLDSSSSLLPESAKLHFPGTFTKASFKYHLCFSLLSGFIPWMDYSEGSSHDSNHFPFLELVKNKLILFDLGYYDLGAVLLERH